MRPTVAGAIAIVLASKVKISATSGTTTGTPPCVPKRGCHTGSSKPCEYDYTCPPPKECCAQGCCFRRSTSGSTSTHTTHPALPSSQVPPVPIPTPPHILTTNLFSVVFWNHWYFWSLLALLLLSCSGCCSLWRRRREPSSLSSSSSSSSRTRGRRGVRVRGGRCHRRYACGMFSWTAMLGCTPAESADPVSEPDSTGSWYPPPQYSRCSSFAQPPPYSEVTSKPDLYPVVISYSENNGKSGSYLMVQYLRNYFVAPGGTSMSATSTADSISSSYVCTNNNEVPVAHPNGLAAPPPPPPPPPPYATSAAVATEPPSSTSSPAAGAGAAVTGAAASAQATQAPQAAQAALAAQAAQAALAAQAAQAAQAAPPFAHPESLRQSASIGSVSSVTTSRSSGSRARETPTSYSLSSEWTSGAVYVFGPGCSSAGCSSAGCSSAGCAARCRGDRLTRPTSLGAGTVSEVSSLMGLTSPGSPPMPTSPTAGNDLDDEGRASELRRLLRQIAALPSRESESWHQNLPSVPCAISTYLKRTPGEMKEPTGTKHERHRFWSSSAPTTPAVPQVPVIVPAQTPLIAAVMPGGNTSSMLLREATGATADFQ